MNFKIVVLLLLHEFCVGQFIGVHDIGQGTAANTCAAVIAQCVKRCDSGLVEDNKGTQYVQMTITLRTSNTKCLTKETGENEMVSTNPPNNNNEVVVFNVPCCQQRCLNKQRSGGIKPAETKRSLTTTVPQNTTSSSTISVVCPQTTQRPCKTTSNNQDPNWAITSLLVLTLLCFVLVFAMFCMVLWIVMRKHRQKSLEPGKELSPPIKTTSNGAILMRVRDNSKRDKTASGSMNNTIASKGLSEFIESNGARLSTTQPRPERKVSSDYIFMDTTTASDKSPEVLIVGGGRAGYYANQVATGSVPTFRREEESDHVDAQMVNCTPSQTIASSTDATQLTMANQKRAGEMKHRSDSSPGKFHIAEYEYDRLDQIISAMKNPKESTSTERMKANSEISRNAGTTSLDRIRTNYNVLRGRDEAGFGGEYQHLRVKQETPESKIGARDLNVQASGEKDSKMCNEKEIDDPYVRDFEVFGRINNSASVNEKAFQERRADN